MSLKSLIVVTAVLVFANCVEKKNFDDSPYLFNYLRVIGDHGNLNSCNKSVCDYPCKGAGPPPTCPEVAPYCKTGCACIFNCEKLVTNCYELKYCVNRKRYLTGKKRTTTITT